MALCRLRVEDCDGWEHTVLGLEWFEELTRLPFNVSHQKLRKGMEFHFICQHAQHGTCWWILVLIDLLSSYIGPAQSDVCSGKAMTSITLITEDLGHVLCVTRDQIQSFPHTNTSPARRWHLNLTYSVLF